MSVFLELIGALFRYIILLPLQITVMGLSISVFFVGIRNKKYSRSIIGIFLTFIVVLLFLRSSFIRSRRVVDTEWMIGKTIEQVRGRYYYPEDAYYPYREINGKTYTLCNSELYRWANLGSDKYINYYVLTDANERITDIYITIDKWYGEDPQNHHYLSRWYINTY